MTSPVASSSELGSLQSVVVKVTTFATGLVTTYFNSGYPYIYRNHYKAIYIFCAASVITQHTTVYMLLTINLLYNYVQLKFQSREGCSVHSYLLTL